MFNKLIQRLLGNNTEHELKKMWPIVRRINDLEPKLAGLSDASLQEKTFEFKNRLANGETLDDILPEAFAVVREASRRVTGMRHFDVQLLGGIVLHRGDIAEMRTGEGKTLVATLPVYLTFDQKAAEDKRNCTDRTAYPTDRRTGRIKGGV